jgi:hypothetical protein
LLALVEELQQRLDIALELAAVFFVETRIVGVQNHMRHIQRQAVVGVDVDALIQQR